MANVIAENYIKLIKAGRRTLESLPDNLPLNIRAEIEAGLLPSEGGTENEPTE